MNPVPASIQTAIASIDGEIMPLAEAKISALDRGFLLGDAVYEVIRVYQGKPWLLADHFRRLEYSLGEIRIHGINLQRLEDRIGQVIRQGKFGEAVIYIQITRGAAPRHHAFPEGIPPLEFFYVQEFVDPYPDFRKNGGMAITFPDLRWQRCDIKSTNLLGNLLAMQTAKEAGCVEAILYRDAEAVTEGTHTSLFGVRDGVVLIPPQTNTRLPGITRKWLVAATQRHSIPTREQSLRRADFSQVGELFLTGTTTEVLPLIQVDGQPIANGQPGPITRRLQEAYRLAVKEFIVSGGEKFCV
jgi:D-alanine transaminase